MPHDTRITVNIDFPSSHRNFRCPYQASVMKILEQTSSRIVFKGLSVEGKFTGGERRNFRRAPAHLFNIYSSCETTRRSSSILPPALPSAKIQWRLAADQYSHRSRSCRP